MAHRSAATTRIVADYDRKGYMYLYECSDRITRSTRYHQLKYSVDVRKPITISRAVGSIYKSLANDVILNMANPNQIARLIFSYSGGPCHVCTATGNLPGHQQWAVCPYNPYPWVRPYTELAFHVICLLPKCPNMVTAEANMLAALLTVMA